MKKRRKKGNNQGTSFIEVIVSMLILAIAVLPLLSSFMTSLRVNLQSRRALSASIVAQNVMECVREYAHFKVVGTNVSEEIRDFLPEHYQNGFLTTAEGFLLSGIFEGSSNFEVRVSYDQSSFTNAEQTGINDYQLPKLTTLEEKQTAVICPSGVTDGAVEISARNYFYDMWLAAQWTLHADDEEYEGPTMEERNHARNSIANGITGKLILKLEHTATANQLLLSAIMEYHYGGSVCQGYSYTELVSDLENLYVFYDPVQLLANGSGSYQITDTVVLDTAGYRIKLFLAVQESTACLGVTDALSVKGPVFSSEGIANQVTLYSSTQLEYGADYTAPFAAANQLLETGSYERMQEVSVEVFLEGTAKRLAVLNGTIVQ